MNKNDIKVFFKRLGKNKQMIIGSALFLVLIFLAVFGHELAPYDPYILNDDLMFAPCSKYIMGTDKLGRDVFSQILYGIRTSLEIGIVAASISAVLGVLIGGVAGYFGGIVDKVLNEFMNVFMMLPTFFLILLIVALFGSSMMNVMIVIGATSWVSNARLMRAQAISIKNRTFVQSAVAIGESRWSIMIHHVIPNGIFPIIAQTTMNISGAILTESSLSFLGLGDPNVFSLGQIINNGKGIMPRCWWVSVFSGMTVILIVLTFFLIGDGINKVLSPKMDANK